MSHPEALPGLERLMEVCRRLELGLRTSPPRHTPFTAGTLIEGLPVDPVLAAVYARLGHAVFASAAEAGLVLTRCDDAENKVEADNRWWSEGYRRQLALPTLLFAGEPMMAYYYATVPSLADAQGRQPVIKVDAYEEVYAIPVASDVDRFFDTYSRYLEALLALPGGREEGISLLPFPWEVPALIGRDGPLVERLAAGHFDSLMLHPDARAWARKVLDAGLSRS